MCSTVSVMASKSNHCLYWKLFIFFILFVSRSSNGGILYPQESESREVKSLDGIWSFRLDGRAAVEMGVGFEEQWYKAPLDQGGSQEVELMPVPSSYNDITQQKVVRDHLGWVWYERNFWTPFRWLKDEKNVFLRFGSANYFASVWVNGEHIMNHTGGHLPFVGDVTRTLKYGEPNLLVVAVNNILSHTTIPQGTLHRPTDHSRYPNGFRFQEYNFDYFHFSGIHRPVYLYTTPKVYIDDITVTTWKIGNSGEGIVGTIRYSVDFKKTSHFQENSIRNEEVDAVKCSVVVHEMKRPVAMKKGCSGVIEIENAQLWWPFLSGPPGKEPGYLYVLEVSLYPSASEHAVPDVYRLGFGIRTVESTNTSFLINGQPFYFKGFGRHEDYNLRGHGLDFVHLIKDHNLIQWTGANSYRTSHYPYAEEILDLTDRLGIVIIDESPAIGISGYSNELLNNHLDVMKSLVQRDKNRASVLMWSIGNEPKSLEPPSVKYFERTINVTRELDPGKRPITIVLSQGFPNDTGPHGLDIISINRYFAWYGDTGRTEVIPLQIPTEVHSWHSKYNKPVLITEYGAGAVAGMHMGPSFVWTEDYQLDYHLAHFKAFDALRKSSPYFIGEMIWNFADFATPQETFRPWGCMKGIFTRERQPKLVAHFVRSRYWRLANETRSFSLPPDLSIDLSNTI